MPPAAKPLEERFWPKVARKSDDECWEWQAALDLNGYGYISLRTGRKLKAHRVAYEFLHGPIPVGLEIDHLCENKACVNPAHLEAVTHQVNCERDKGKRTTCKYGHPLDGLRRSTDARGLPYLKRACRTCRRLHQRKRYAEDADYRARVVAATARSAAKRKLLQGQ